MKKVFNDIKTVLSEEACVSLDSYEEALKPNGDFSKFKARVADNRFEYIEKRVKDEKDKDDEFYTDLIELLADFIDALYVRDERKGHTNFLTESGIIEKNINIYDFCRRKIIRENFGLCRELFDYVPFELRNANEDLARKLFDYICEILEHHKGVTMTIETIKKLLNRDPQMSTLIAGRTISKNLDFERLSKTIRKNGTIKKSGIKLDDVYQMLIDIHQITSSEVFGQIITPEEFRENHEKLDEKLKSFHATSYITATGIIVSTFDKDYDWSSLIESKTEGDFREEAICELLSRHPGKKEVSLIHRLLSSEERPVDYNYKWQDSFGQIFTLRTKIAMSGKPLLIRDMLSKEENIKPFYYSEPFYYSVGLYTLYIQSGEYDKALDEFEAHFNYKRDYSEDFDDDFERRGYAYGDIVYNDSFTEIIEDLCKSLKDSEIEYQKAKEIIHKFLTHEKTRYINLEGVLPIIKECFTEEDIQALLEELVARRNAGKVGFITVRDNDYHSSNRRYMVTLIDNQNLQEYLKCLKDGKKFTIEKRA